MMEYMRFMETLTTLANEIDSEVDYLTDTLSESPLSAKEQFEIKSERAKLNRLLEKIEHLLSDENKVEQSDAN